ncbi:MAG: bifunctional 2-C-methyl-D-erythritol 4-phosphate cytidylyltransferase/2-C-methyl-D-erythritol 2,4-cyclodiphosphate synthase [Alphaproteobacteria bacterium]|nr:bifunctional 2-C-methyl-D-erythritol 4-phosphate cytidylyltransferase/2-C-methyl-D-erythritol 2,4-cyclodiphosphate synthase [Alphaproteobacteria bacterium]
MKTAAIIVAGGSGLRAGGELPKQYQLVGDRPVIAHTLIAFCAHPEIELVQPVIGSGHEELFAQACGNIACLAPATGGATRQASVMAGLEALRTHGPDCVLIHDAARPFVSTAIISDTIAALQSAGGAIPVLPVVDTIKRAEDGRVLETVDRSQLRAAQTPQAFRFTEIFRAHTEAEGESVHEFTDDASIGEWAGLNIAMVDGAAENRKLTTQSDIAEANSRHMSENSNPLNDIRTGQGYDVHAFEDGNAVILCGVEIAHNKKLKGHSDADVGMHALTDAILGALAEGDIGKHFPPSDPKWKGAASQIFLEAAAEMVTARGGKIAHGDVTLICEEPKIGAHVDAMRDALAKIIGIERGRISVKATTSERLGFTGRGEGIAALASATVRLPE